jgi:hypothetical protein
LCFRAGGSTYTATSTTPARAVTLAAEQQRRGQRARAPALAARPARRWRRLTADTPMVRQLRQRHGPEAATAGQRRRRTVRNCGHADCGFGPRWHVLRGTAKARKTRPRSAAGPASSAAPAATAAPRRCRACRGQPLECRLYRHGNAPAIPARKVLVFSWGWPLAAHLGWRGCACPSVSEDWRGLRLVAGRSSPCS